MNNWFKKLNLLSRLYFLKFRVSKKDSIFKKESHKYLSTEIKSGNLNYKQLKYLYNNIYNKTDDVIQSLIPVSQAMIKGIPINEIERIVKKLPYAINSKDNSELYSKNYKDLKFILDKYITYIDRNVLKSNIERNIYKYLSTLKMAYLNNIPKDKIYKYVEENVKKSNNHIKIKTSKAKYRVRIKSNNKYYVRDFSSYKSAENFLKHYKITQQLKNTIPKEIKNNDKDLEL